MANRALKSTSMSQSTPDSQRLDSWKEIAVYLKRDVRTVRRWEKSERLPVHRHLHKKQSTVYAFSGELDAWRSDRESALNKGQDTASGRQWGLGVGISVLLIAGVLMWHSQRFLPAGSDPGRPLGPEVREAYLKGRFFGNQAAEAGLKRAVGYFEVAIEKDPACALAFSGLADSNIMLVALGYQAHQEAIPKAKAALRKALEINESLAEVQTSLGAVKSYEWDWSSAEQAYLKALKLNPGYVTARQRYAQLLVIIGRYEDALKELNQAQSLDPLGPRTRASWVMYYYLTRRYSQAIEQGQRILELEPNSVAGLRALGRSYAQMGMYEQAITTLGTAVTLSEGNVLPELELAHAYAAAGKKEEALKILKQVDEDPKKRNALLSLQAEVFAVLGDKGRAFACLQKAFEEHEPRLALLKLEPGFDPLRTDPRFNNLVRRVGLPP